MTVNWHEIVWGRPTAPRFEVIGTFGAIVALTLIATAVTNSLASDHLVRRFFYDVGLPVVLFYASGVAAFGAAYLRCGVLPCLVIGLIPAASFVAVSVVGSAIGVPGVGSGDAPLWSITLAFATISMLSAIVGCIGGLVIGVFVR